MRKIAVVTGSRAEYGLLEPLLRRIQDDPALTLRLVVTGAHLERRFGLTVREIVKDGYPIAARVDLELGAGRPEDVARSIAHGVRRFAKAFSKLRPDLLVVLGDRFEILAAAVAALPLRLPVAHLHGGEASEGVWDESVRHAVTKLSHLHFTAGERYAARVLQMGELPDRVFDFGSPFVDRARALAGMPKSELEKSLGLELAPPVGLLTFHPETLDADLGLKRLERVLEAALASPLRWVVTYPNADAGGRRLLERLKRFAAGGSGRVRAFDSLGHARYFSLLRHAALMLGNSSSGILEAPYFRLPVVNVGDRQKGRTRLGNVIDVRGDSPGEVALAIKRALSAEFRREVEARCPGLPKTSPSDRIVRVLKTAELGPELLRKTFHELPHTLALPHQRRGGTYA